MNYPLNRQLGNQPQLRPGPQLPPQPQQPNMQMGQAGMPMQQPAPMAPTMQPLGPDRAELARLAMDSIRGGFNAPPQLQRMPNMNPMRY